MNRRNVILASACVVVAGSGCSDSAIEAGATHNYATTMTVSPDDKLGTVIVQRVGDAHDLHAEADGRGLFADVILVGPQRVFATFQLADSYLFCEGKSLYYREYDRDLNPVGSRHVAIDVTEVGTIFRPTADTPGDQGDHKIVFMEGKFVMVTTIPGGHEARLIRFDLDFNTVDGDSLYDDSTLARVGNEHINDRLLDMGFAFGGGHLYAQFFYQGGSTPADWAAKIYKLTPNLQLVDSAIVVPESGTFVTGTSLAWVPAGQMGMTENSLQSFSPNKDYGSVNRLNIHTFTTRDSNMTIIPGSTRTITDAPLDAYFPTGGVWNGAHQLWIVGYTLEIAEGVHGSQVNGADACDPTSTQPPGEELREVGPSFISIYDAEWNEIDTILLNNGDPAFRVMVDSEGDDIYVAYDEVDLYAWQDVSIAKLEHFRIIAAR